MYKIIVSRNRREDELVVMSDKKLADNLTVRYQLLFGSDAKVFVREQN